MKRTILCVTIMLLFCSLVLLSACTSAPSPTASTPPNNTQSPTTPTSSMASPTASTRTITFYAGTADEASVTVPAKINRIACGWNAENSIIAMLGYGDQIVATTDIIKASPVFAKFVPSIKNAVLCFNGSDVNIEGLIQAKPDITFIMTGSGGTGFKKIQEMGIPVAFLRPNSMQNLLDRTLITGQILGSDADQRAQQYVDYFKQNIANVKAVVDKIPQDQRVKVYHCLSGGLNTSAAPSLNQDWMDLAGVINVAKGWKLASSQTGSNATLEQVIGADPDIIIAMNYKDAQTIKSDPAWANIKAVKKGKVYTNPKGMFWWCRETTEEALQPLWVAKTAYPDQFADLDMVKVTKDFYKTFYGYELSDEDVQSFLNPQQ